jgi:pimeloyl-ACP methyl ester carboxylesterase
VRATTRLILAAVLTVLMVPAPAVAAPVSLPEVRDSVLSWTPCAQDSTAQCATLPVPVDWSDPYSAKVALSVARRTASNPAERIGTLIVNPGGPGGSGVDFAVDSPYFFSDAVQRHFDIVGFDPPGVGHSTPVQCTATLVAAAPSPLITSPRAYAATVAYNRKLAADCRANTGAVYDHADTLTVVRDMDLLRAALGDPKLTFYGASYGTLLGEQYADRFPNRVRAIVLDSVMDHSAGIDGFLGTLTDAAQDSFDQFVAWCARDATCVIRGRDIRAMWAALLARAAAGKLRDPYDQTAALTVSALLGVAFSSLYEPQWYALAHYLKEASAQSDQPGGAGPTGPSGLIQSPFAAVFCNDWRLPVTGYDDYRARLAALRRRAPQMLASPLALTATAGCLGRTAPTANPQRPLRPASTPILLVNARHDPATAFKWALDVREQLGPAAALLIYDGWGHVAYNRSTCLSDAVDDYLITGAVPVAGTHCPPVPPVPFGVGGLAGGQSGEGVGKHAPAGQRGSLRWGYR